MKSKALPFLSLLCILSYCRGEVKKTLHMRQQDTSIKPVSATSDTMFIPDSSFWDTWKPGKILQLGHSILSQGLTHSEDAMDSYWDRGGHRDRGRGKIKKKVKFLIKIHQYET